MRSTWNKEVCYDSPAEHNDTSEETVNSLTSPGLADTADKDSVDTNLLTSSKKPLEKDYSATRTSCLYGSVGIDTGPVSVEVSYTNHHDELAPN